MVRRLKGYVPWLLMGGGAGGAGGCTALAGSTLTSMQPPQSRWSSSETVQGVDAATLRVGRVHVTVYPPCTMAFGAATPVWPVYGAGAPCTVAVQPLAAAVSGCAASTAFCVLSLHVYTMRKAFCALRCPAA